MKAIPTTALLLLALLPTTGCSAASYSERMAYLRKVANRGAETHGLLTAQGANIDAKRCSAAYDGLEDGDIPSDIAGDSASAEWRAQVRQFSVDSCVTGLPKPVPGQTSPQPPSTTSSSPPPSAPTKTPTKTP